MNNHAIRLLHIDHYHIMHDIIRRLLDNAKENIFISQSNDFNECQCLLEKEHFDIFLIGFNKEGPLRHEFSRYLQFLSLFRVKYPGLKIIVYSMGNNPREISEIMNSGADWIITGSMGYETLLEAIQTVNRGDRHISQQLCDMFKNPFEYLSGLADTLIPKKMIFSRRELEVLNLIASGCSTKTISDVLRIAAKTVETHRKNLMKKAKVRNTAELISFSYHHRML